MNDDARWEKHTGGIPTGTVRDPAPDEVWRRENYFRASSILDVSGALPEDLSPFERHVANLIDGKRPVARIRKKSGLSSADLRIALASLADRKLLVLVGIVEEAVGQLAREIADEVQEAERMDATVAGASGDVIPPHVMMEIQAMLDEEDVRRSTEGDSVFDEATAAQTIPEDDD